MKLIKEACTIYITSPANAATGGPLLLHQLANKLILLGFNAKMFYPINEEGVNPVHDFYSHFNLPYTLKIDDVENNLLIISESYPDLIFRYKNIQKVIWWLSVDNYPGHENYKRSFSLKRFLGIKKTHSLSKFSILPKHQNWVQSYYAENYLKSRGVAEIDTLSDYLDFIYIEESKNKIFDESTKKNIVVYNPKKGYAITQKLIQSYPEISWIAIENMTPKEVKNLLLSAKIYIDFGNHPGKDRIPREAAMCGCIVITNKNGSAKFQEDVTIPIEYKKEYSAHNETKIADLIKNCFLNYNTRIKDFHDYKEKIINEEKKFDRDLNSIINNQLFKDQG